MSQALASAAQRRVGADRSTPPPSARPTPPAGRPQLRMVRAPALDHGRGLFLLSCLLMLLAGLIALLLINTSLAKGSFRLHDLERNHRELADTEQALAEDLAAQAAPEVLARRARALGMVPIQDPAFVSVPDGRILGKPRPAVKPSATAVRR